MSIIKQQEQFVSITTWIPDSVIGLVFACINGWLLKQEYNHMEIGDAKQGSGNGSQHR